MRPAATSPLPTELAAPGHLGWRCGERHGEYDAVKPSRESQACGVKASCDGPADAATCVKCAPRQVHRGGRRGGVFLKISGSA